MLQITGQNNDHARNFLLVRIPEVLTLAINQLYKGQHSKEIEELGKLIYDLKRNKEIQSFNSNRPYLLEWNNVIQNLINKTYFDAPTLFSQCYVYCKLESVVYHLNIDVFAADKLKLLEDAIEEYVPFLPNQSAESQLFQLLLNCLDCSSPIEYLINNDFNQFWAYLQGIKQGNIQIVLNNVGHEFLSDLFLADFLVENGFASSITFHVKPYLFFFNNITLKDVDIAFTHFSKNNKLQEITQKWINWRSRSIFIFKSDAFWTMPYHYVEMQVKAPELHSELSNSDLVIFKGDYNYRKLTGDDSSDTAKFNLNTATQCSVLRKLKSDTLVGLDVKNKQELTELDLNWQTNGKYAVLQCFK